MWGDRAVLGKAVAASLLDQRTQERLELADIERADAAQEVRIMKAAAKASGARGVAHRDLLRACVLERRKLHLDYALQREEKLGKQLYNIRKLRRDAHKCNLKTRKAIQRAKSTHERALKMNEEYRGIWKDKDWCDTIVDFHQANGRPHWMLKPNVSPSYEVACDGWTEEAEVGRLERAMNFAQDKSRGPDSYSSSEYDSSRGLRHPQDSGLRGIYSDSEDFDITTGFDWYEDNDNVNIDAEWYEDDKTILRRLFEFP